MNILIITPSDITGGASRAAFRLHEALLQNEINSQMLVEKKSSDINSVLALGKIALPAKIKLLEKFRSRLYKITLNRDKILFKKSKKTMTKNFGPFSPQVVSNIKLLKIINEINPDIVHLHWICGDYLSIEDIAKISAPIVWSLHDMWSFTGGCHYVADQILQHGGDHCDKYTKNCGSCALLGSKKANDLSFYVLKRKKKTFAKVESMTVVGLSKWMQNCAKKSAVFTDKKVVCLPNPINTNVFKPIEEKQSRILWNLPEGKKLILFGAMGATSASYKGFELLIEALNKISTENVEFIVFGSGEPKNPPKLSKRIHYLGHLSDDVSLVSLYNACDLMIVPSKRENLSNVIMESLACGTPVACFDVGGNSDMVTHMVNGYLAQPFDTADLAKGIDWVLNNERYDELAKNAREKVVNEFNYCVVAKKYIELYEEIHNARIKSGK